MGIPLTPTELHICIEDIEELPPSHVTAGHLCILIICFCVELARETFLYGYMFQVLLNFITVLPKFLLRYFTMTIVPCLSLVKSSIDVRMTFDLTEIFT